MILWKIQIWTRMAWRKWIIKNFFKMKPGWLKIIQGHEHAPVPYDLKKTNYVRMKINKRNTAIFISVLLLILCILLNYIYRPYIYRNHIFDFHFADSFTSWICVPCGTLFFWGISRSKKFIKVFLGIWIGCLIYESFLGLTFDWYDLIALLLSGSITYLIYILYIKRRSTWLGNINCLQ